MKPPEVYALVTDALGAFCRERGFALNTEDERARAFELFAAALVLPRHQVDEYELEAVMMRGAYDTQLDSVAIIANGLLVTSDEDVAAALKRAEETGELRVDIVFVQATYTQQLIADKLAKFGVGALNFLQSTSELRENQSLKRLRGAKARLLGAYAHYDGDKSCAITLYYVWAGMLRASAPDGDGYFKLLPKMLGNIVKGATVCVEPIHGVRALELWRRARAPLAGDFRFPGAAHIAPSPGVSGGLIGVASASELLKLVENDDGELLDNVFRENVRHFQGESLPVNRAIADTLTGPERARFALLNNGVTIVAKGFTRDADGLVSVHDYQIVNGCQTSVMLSRNRDFIDDTVQVPLKLVATTDEAVKDAIVRGANSQTTVSENDLLSRLPFVRRLQDVFDERRLGRDGETEFERRIGEKSTGARPPAHIVRIDSLIKAFGAVWLARPHDAHARPAALRALAPTDLFTVDHDPEFYIAAANVLVRVRQLIGRQRYPAEFQVCYAMRILMGGGDPVSDFSAAGASAVARKVTSLASDLRTGKKFARNARDAVARAAKRMGSRKLSANDARSAEFTEAVREAAVAMLR